MCSAFNVLPSSFILPPPFVIRDATPFASGGYSNVYGATFHDRPIVLKTLNVATKREREKLHIVSSPNSRAPNRLLILYP